MNSAAIKALLKVSRPDLYTGADIGRAISVRTWAFLVDKGFATGGETADAPLVLTLAGSAALLEAI